LACSFHLVSPSSVPSSCWKGIAWVRMYTGRSPTCYTPRNTTSPNQPAPHQSTPFCVHKTTQWPLSEAKPVLLAIPHSTLTMPPPLYHPRSVPFIYPSLFGCRSSRTSGLQPCFQRPLPLPSNAFHGSNPWAHSFPVRFLFPFVLGYHALKAMRTRTQGDSPP